MRISVIANSANVLEVWKGFSKGSVDFKSVSPAAKKIRKLYLEICKTLEIWKNAIPV